MDSAATAGAADTVAAVAAVAAWLLLAFWAVVACGMALGWRRMRWLRDVAPAPESAGRPLPRLAVIVPALDEEAGIRAALESLAAQDYPGLIVVPVNDRSTDRTGAIMDEVAAAVPAGEGAARVRPLHVRELPPEWLGKNHACALGARAALEAGAEWLLFTDGDVQFAPQALRKAIAYAVERDLRHLAIGPELIFRSFGEAILLAEFMVLFTIRFRPWLVEDPRSRGYVGVGAFNLIRADAYRAIGGHERLALTVVDDVALGKLVRDAGLKRSFLSGEGEVKVAWQPSLAATVRGMHKNGFASLDFSVLKAIGAVGFPVFAGVLPYALPFLAAGPARAAAVAALALLVLVHAQSARFLRRPWPYALAAGACAGFGSLLIAWAILGSTVVTLRQGGVVWRGTLYPSKLLRERQVRV